MDLDSEGSAAALEAPSVLGSVRASIVDVTGSSLVGLYVYGSLVAGGFEPEISDIDLIAVLADDPSDELSTRLELMHDSFAVQHPDWAGRIDVVYVAQARLRKPLEEIPRIAVISPGEPFHVVSGGREWLLTWYPAREEGVALVGPAISKTIPELPEDEFLETVRGRLREFRTELEDDAARGSCAYTVFTVCRGLYTLEFGIRPSKTRAAEWVADRFPEWASLVESATAWRRQRWTAHGPDRHAVAVTRRFVEVMTEGIDGQPMNP
jgi:hypothetical protein